jgi:hypothetical protein
MSSVNGHIHDKVKKNLAEKNSDITQYLEMSPR